MIQNQSFSINQPTKIIFGTNSVKQLGNVVTELGGRKVFLVVDPGLKRQALSNR